VNAYQKRQPPLPYPEALASHIAVDPTAFVELFTGYAAETLLNAVTLVAGLAIAALHRWDAVYVRRFKGIQLTARWMGSFTLAISLFACYPVASTAGDLQFYAFVRLGKKMKKACARSVRVIIETVPGIRTTLALGLPEYLMGIYVGKSGW
jgi:hypothetical protein